MSARVIGRPALPVPENFELSGDDWRKIRLVTSDDRAGGLTTLAGGLSTYRVFIADTARQWAALRLLDGALGPPSAADRAQVRLATTIIAHNIRWMMFQAATGATGAVKDSQLEPIEALPPSVKLVDQCGLLKDWE